MIHSILFTGHMIDAPNRESPRFPAGKENAARTEIRKQLIKEREKAKDRLTGIAAGACGGDILFHELCAETGISTEIFLALPVEEFKQESVSPAGADWEKRYDRLIKKLPIHLLPDRKDSKDVSVWERANLWMLTEALKNGGKNMTLIALWDGKGGDGNGGTEHMVNVAQKEGATIKIIDINKL